MGSSLLKRMFGLHVKFFGHLVAEITRHVVIKGLTITANTAANACGMGGKHRGHMRQAGFDIEQSHAGRPFIKMGHRLQFGVILPSDDTFDDKTGSIGKHA